MRKTLVAIAVACAFASPQARAQQTGTLPTGGRVVGGQATISQSGSAMQIQQASSRAALDWQTFSIGAGASVVFNQPSASAIALNRVLGSDPSQIFGRLSANGQVFLTNPNGILFGRGVQADVGGLLASTLSMSPEDFMAGRYLLRGNGTGASIVNEGTLRALPKGYVALIAPSVTNTGTIEAPSGVAALTAANAATLDFMADGLVRIRVDEGALDAQIANQGAIRADGGAVLLTANARDSLAHAVVNNTGVIEARSVENIGGVIRLGGREVRNSGEIRAEGPGGQITIEATANASSKGATGFENRGTVSASTVEIRSEGTAYAFGISNYGEILAAERATLAAPGNTLVNQGSIATNKGGRVELSADLVSAAGTVRAPGGAIDVKARSVYQTGVLDASDAEARGGDVRISTSRAYDATSEALISADGLEGGSINVNGGEYGRVMTSGTMSARGSERSGGEVFVSTWNTTLLGGTIDASGKTGGGRILFGGGRHGDGSEVPLATHAMVTPGARLLARGATGGEIVVYGKTSLDFYGDAEAQGSAGTRNGGFIELSSAGEWRLASQSIIDAGPGGTFLIDPKNVTIDAAGVSVVSLAKLALKLAHGSTPASGSPNLLSLNDGDQFGTPIAISSDRLAAGAPDDDTVITAGGAVYLFDGLGGSGAIATPRLAKKLAHGSALAPGGAASTLSLASFDFFGSAVALSADRLAVGAYRDDTGSADSGAAYLFDGLGASGTLSTPRLAMKLANGSGLASGGAAGTLTLAGSDNFGRAVALSADRLAIGADRDGISDSGAVYLFDGLGSSGTIATPRLAAKLAHGSALDPGGMASTLSLAGNDNFGRSVALSADRLAVGAPNDDIAGTNRGSAYLFDGLGSSGVIATPRLAMKLIHGSTLAAGGAADPLPLADNDRFGQGVALSADRLAVGADGDDTGGGNRGAVYLFDGLGSSGAIVTPRLAAKLAHGSALASGGMASTLSLANNDTFGAGVALSADRLAVGAFGDNGNTSGAAHLFDGLGSTGAISTPRLAVKLAHGSALAPGGAAGTLSLVTFDQFGSAVALAADRLAVGAVDDDTGIAAGGAVYLFDGLGSIGTIATPRLAMKLAHGSALASGGAASTLSLTVNDWFGGAVALSADRVAVGAPFDPTGGIDRGAVYLFDGLGTSGTVSTPRLAMKLAHGSALASGGVASTLSLAADNFGRAVALSADRLAVGALIDDTGGFNRGAVYLFDGLGSTGAIATPRLAMKLAHGSALASGGVASTLSLIDNDQFGTAVALSADRLAVGAPLDDAGGFSRGAVHLFDGLGASGTISTPRLAMKLAHGSTLAPGGAASTLTLIDNDQFGTAVALSTDRLAVGAPFDDTGGTSRGAAYLFDGLGSTGAIGTPRLAMKLAHGSTLASGGAASTLSLVNVDQFGWAIALSADRLAVGAPFDDTGGSAKGAVYLFQLIAGGAAFADSPAADQSISATSLANFLSTGQNVVLQANNDITVNAAVNVNNASGDGGALTLQAGRSVLINSSIATDNGAVTIVANERAANGVVDAHRDAGAAVITMAAGTTINAGNANISITLNDGAGLTNNTSGDITLANLTTTGNVNVALSASGSITQSAGAITGTDVSLIAGGSIGVNTASTGTLALSTGGAGAAGNISVTESNALNTNRVIISTAVASAQTVSLTSTNAGGITVGGDQDFSAKGNDNFTLTASGGNIAGGAGRITTTGALVLAGTGIGSVANPVLLNLGGSGTLNAAATGAGSAGDIAVTETSSAGLKVSQIAAFENTHPSAHTFTLKQTGVGGIVFDVPLTGTPGSSTNTVNFIATAGPIALNSDVDQANTNLSFTGVGVTGGGDISTFAAAGTGRNAGDVSVISSGAGAISIGTIAANGASGTNMPGGRGGNIFITAADGAISTGAIFAGGGTVDPGSNGAFSGGAGSNVTVQVTAPTANRNIFIGSVDTGGGFGRAISVRGGVGSHSNPGFAGGQGGRGGDVLVATALGSVSIPNPGFAGHIAVETAGGSGGNANSAPFSGGAGADAGNATILANGAGGNVAMGSIFAVGGGGGGAGGPGGTGGNGGAGGAFQVASQQGTVLIGAYSRGGGPGGAANGGIAGAAGASSTGNTVTGPAGVTVSTSSAGGISNAGTTISNAGTASPINLFANAIDLTGGAVNGGSGNVLIRPAFGNNTVSLGIEDSASTVNVTDASLDTISTTGSLMFGGSPSGNDTYAGNITIGTGATLSQGSKNLLFRTMGGTGNSIVVNSAGVATTTGNIAFEATGTVALNGPIATTSGNVTLNASNLITQTAAGTINTGGTLTGSASGVHLDQNNAVASVGPFTLTGGPFVLNDTGGLTVVAPISSGGSAHITTSGPLVLNSDVAGPQGIHFSSVGLTQTAGTTVNSGTGLMDLDAGGGAVNLLGTLKADGTQEATISIFRAANVVLGNVIVPNGEFELGYTAPGEQITGPIVQNPATVIQGRTLIGNTTSSVTLTNNNLIDNIGPFNAGGAFALNDSSGGLNITGPLSTTGAASITTAGGALALTGTGALTFGSISANTVTALSSGALSLAAGASITATGGGDALQLAGASFINDAGAGALSAPAGRWLVWSGTPVSDTVGALPFDFKHYGATFGSTTPAQGSGSGLLYTATPPASTLSLTGSAIKVYDANTVASLSAANFTAPVVFSGDVPTVSFTGATYDNQNAGSGKTVTATGVGISVTSSGKPVFGYALTSTTASGPIGEVAARPISVRASDLAQTSGNAIPTTDTFTLSAGSLAGTDALGSTVPVTTTATTASPAGTYPLTPSSASFTAGSATNYAVSYVDGTLTLVAPPPASTQAQAESPSFTAAITTATTTTSTASSTTTATPRADSAGAGAVGVSQSIVSVPQEALKIPDFGALLAAADERRESKRSFLTKAVQLLEQDPNIADLPNCAGAPGGNCIAVRDPSTPDRDAASDRTPTLAHLPAIGRKVALLIGVGDYAGPIPKLDSPVKDVEEIGRIYRELLGYEVRILANADKGGIIQEINRLIQEAGSRDSVTVMYAGHGHVVERTQRGYWIPARASADDPRQWISNNDIARALQNIAARQVLLVSDSCYSGTLARESRIERAEVLPDPAAVLAKRSVTVLTSGGEEPVPDQGRDGHSVFAWHFMRQLREVKDVSLGVSLHERIADRVQADIPQRPQYGAGLASGHERGADYLFEVRRYE